MVTEAGYVNYPIVYYMYYFNNPNQDIIKEIRNYLILKKFNTYNRFL